MIADNSPKYYCASVDTPVPAAFVCTTQGCTAYPFLCGRTTCPCMDVHRKHNCQPLTGFLEELAAPTKIPEMITKESKDIDVVITTMINELDSLRMRHR